MYDNRREMVEYAVINKLLASITDVLIIKRFKRNLFLKSLKRPFSRLNHRKITTKEVLRIFSFEFNTMNMIG